MKRVLLLVPKGLTFDLLTTEQQEAIRIVFGQYVNPMPSSIVYNNLQLVDALTQDNFNPATMIDYGIDWPIIGLMQWDGLSAEVDVIVPLDTELYKKFMPDGSLTECHRWAGWPDGGFDGHFSEWFTI